MATSKQQSRGTVVSHHHHEHAHGSILKSEAAGRVTSEGARAPGHDPRALEEAGRTLIEVKKLDQSRIEAIQFVIANMNQIVVVMKDRSTSQETEWDPQWPHTLSLSH